MALIAVTALSGCADSSTVGAAVTAGDYRMSEQQLTDLVKESQKAQKQYGASVTAASDLSMAAINAHIFEQILIAAAKTAAVKVSDSQANGYMNQQYAAAGKPAVLGQWASIGYPPRIAKDYARMYLLFNAVSVVAADGKSGQAGQEKVMQYLSKAAADLKINVAPRYGSYDVMNLRLQEPANSNVSPGK